MKQMVMFFGVPGEGENMAIRSESEGRGTAGEL